MQDVEEPYASLRRWNVNGQFEIAARGSEGHPGGDVRADFGGEPTDKPGQDFTKRRSLTFTYKNPPAPGNPVGSAAHAKASRQPPTSTATRSAATRGLLAHIATLTRNDVRFACTTATVPMLPSPPTSSAKPSK